MFQCLTAPHYAHFQFSILFPQFQWSTFAPSIDVQKNSMFNPLCTTPSKNIQLPAKTHALTQAEASRSRKGWTFPMCGEFTDRPETHICCQKTLAKKTSHGGYGTFKVYRHSFTRIMCRCFRMNTCFWARNTCVGAPSNVFEKIQFLEKYQLHPHVDNQTLSSLF